jgi:superfamily I DNA and/or RNA helicase
VALLAQLAQRRPLVPLIRGERWVLVGDHQQLPPYADDALQARLVREGLDSRIVTRSLFEELQEPFERRGCYVFLGRQGRMHPDISSFVSRQFYGCRLHDFPDAATHIRPGPPLPLRLETAMLAAMGYVTRDESRQSAESFLLGDLHSQKLADYAHHLLATSFRIHPTTT